MYLQLGVDQETDACSWREFSACLARAHSPSVWWVGGGVPVNESDQSVQLNNRKCILNCFDTMTVGLYYTLPALKME